MNWFFIALLAPALWSITNHIDKFLITKYFKNTGLGAFFVFSALIGILVLPFVLLFHHNVLTIGISNATIIVLSGILYIVCLIPYAYALQKDEASIVVPLFQVIPIFGFVLAYFGLGEKLTTQQVFASLFILFGAVGISIDLSKRKFKKEVFWLMMLSSFLFALNGFVFKFVAIKDSFWVTAFWEYIGLSIAGIFMLLFVSSYRNQFIAIIKQNVISVIGINILNDVINISAKLIMNFATLLAPLALVWVVNGFQPFFVFIFGIFLTLFFPKFNTESLIKRDIIQKVLAIILMFIGVYFLQ
jgi:uncharacterized membrane protein